MTSTDFQPESLWAINAEAHRKAEANGRFLDDSVGRCMACGRKVTNGLAVEVAISGYVIPLGDPRSGTDESQGWWDIGPECIRRVLSPEQRKALRAAQKAV